jgi:hypothetical protein
LIIIFLSFLLLREADAVKIVFTQDQAKKREERYLKLFRFPDEAFLKWLDSKSLTMEDAELYLKNKLILKRFYERNSVLKRFRMKRPGILQS